jgi:hypothetical protein
MTASLILMAWDRHLLNIPIKGVEYPDHVNNYQILTKDIGSCFQVMSLANT